MSQEAVALGMRERNADHKWSQATVWSIERGDRSLKAAEVDDLSRVLEVGSLVFVLPDRVGPKIIDLNQRGNELQRAVVKALAALEEATQTGEKLSRYLKALEAAKDSFTPEQWEQIEPHRVRNNKLAQVMATLSDGTGSALVTAAAELRG